MRASSLNKTDQSKGFAFRRLPSDECRTFPACHCCTWNTEMRRMVKNAFKISFTPLLKYPKMPRGQEVFPKLSLVNSRQSRCHRSSDIFFPAASFMSGANHRCHSSTAIPESKGGGDGWCYGRGVVGGKG